MAKQYPGPGFASIVRYINLSTPQGAVIWDIVMQGMDHYLDSVGQNPTLSPEQWLQAFEAFLVAHRPAYDLYRVRPDLFEMLPQSFCVDDFLTLFTLAQDLWDYRPYMAQVASRLDLDGLEACLYASHTMASHWAWEASGSEMIDDYIQRFLARFARYGRTGTEELLEMFEQSDELARAASWETLSGIIAGSPAEHGDR